MTELSLRIMKRLLANERKKTKLSIVVLNAESCEVKAK